MIDFDDIFIAQRKQNQIIREINPLGENGKSEWTKQLLLGMVSEIGEVMDRIDWKVHSPRNQRISVHNLKIEIVDLFKYVLSLAELWEMTPHELLSMTRDKTSEIALKMSEQMWRPKQLRPILVTDIDGTIADWKSSFMEFVREKGVSFQIDDSKPSMSIETEMGLQYVHYEDLKWEFETGGGYARLHPIPRAVNFIIEMQNSGADIVVFTARPSSNHKRIWWDSWTWLEQQGIFPSLLRIGSEDRISYAQDLREQGFDVKMVDDNPELTLRAVNSNIPVILRDTPYNQAISHDLVDRRFWE